MSDDFEIARQGSKGKKNGAPCDRQDNEVAATQEPWTPASNNAIGTEAISRRGFLQGTALLAGGLAATTVPGSAAHAQEQRRAVEPVRKLPLSLTINGEHKELQVDPRISLLDLLREQLELTGTKKGCDHGQCGACTVIAGGRRINSCLSLALVHDGDSITTVEGLAKGDALHPVQTAFLENDGYQCGYCTPGQICSAVALLDEVKKGEPSYVTENLQHPGPVELSVEEIKERMSGNLCRCGAYPGIVAAVQQAYREHSQQS
ncbi:2Fe-2S iron-sulfur cluster-binding protein [Acidipila sp. EB88]|uniref:2Fe-2S iron-sulfur cluster-binding protein n=1 Tax=Acidipila sp. EB88 TaxID=2305226 RepID=UPI000F5E56D4|nr:2Fe-2S iron-sulfur cluster-binding protein [Acidipila sp. EB88]RRA47438.1 twin-arginine translocation signal domain-containing protein [Acidipila sp. EB88]